MGYVKRCSAGFFVALWAAVLVVSGTLAASPSGASTRSTRTGSSVPTVAGGVKGGPGYLVYWDQNEEVDFLSMPSGVRT